MGDLTEKGVRSRLPEKQDGEETHLTAVSARPRPSHDFPGAAAADRREPARRAVSVKST